jgi:glucose-6-phosphate 1-epimerase
VVSWTPASAAPGGEGERLFVSARSAYRAGAAVRGGIPVIFPQFAAEGPYARHGFARTRPWTLVGAGRGADGAGEAEFALADDEATRALWPFAFRCRLRVRAAAAWLEVALAVENPGDGPFAFTAALHTYLRVGDVEAARVRGLERVPYRDQAAGRRRRRPGGRGARARGEVDRVYRRRARAGARRRPGARRATRGHARGVRRRWWRGTRARRSPRGLADLEPAVGGGCSAWWRAAVGAAGGAGAGGAVGGAAAPGGGRVERAGDAARGAGERA